ncbi:MAG: hypothetical protein VW935_04205 [Novosphingobium sp.]
MRCLGSPILLALASLATTQAHAQDVARANRAMELNATAGSACIVGTPRALSATNSTFQADGGSGGQITLTRLVDPDTALPRSARVDLAIPATCNASHRVIASSGAGGLRRAGGGGVQTGGFADFLAYSVQVAWAGAQREQRSDSGSLIIPVSDAASGDVSLRVTTPDGGTPLIAGQYDDTIVIQLQPAE